MCAEYRLPHSAFLRWSHDDRSKAIWQYVRARSRCGTCGTRPAEWDETAGGDRHAYHATHRRCRGCELLQQEQDRVSKRPELGRGIQLLLRRRT